jgi:hypothetical protein
MNPLHTSCARTRMSEAESEPSILASPAADAEADADADADAEADGAAGDERSLTRHRNMVLSSRGSGSSTTEAELSRHLSSAAT